MNKKLKIILIVSFVPYILVLLCGILCAIHGVTFIYNEVYGTDAFILGVMALGALLVFYVPIIPVCAIFQVVYLVRRKISKNKTLS